MEYGQNWLPETRKIIKDSEFYEHKIIKKHFYENGNLCKSIEDIYQTICRHEDEDEDEVCLII